MDYRDERSKRRGKGFKGKEKSAYSAEGDGRVSDVRTDFEHQLQMIPPNPQKSAF